MSFPFSPRAKAAIGRAERLALAQNSALVSEAHLFLATLDDPTEEVVALLALSGVTAEAARLYAENALEIEPPSQGKPIRLSVGAQKALHLAAVYAQSESVLPEPHHLFIACLAPRRGPHLGQTLEPLGLSAAKLRGHLRGLKASRTKLKLTARAEKALEAAQAEMRAGFCGRIRAAHLLLGILSDEENVATEMLQKAGCNREDLRKRARETVKSDGEIAMPQKRFSPGAKRALERAGNAAKAAGHKHIDCGYLLIGLLPARETIGDKWRARGRELDSVEGLWTAEQVAALRGEVASAPERLKRKSGEEFSPLSPRLLWLGSFGMSLIWSAFVFVHKPGSNRSDIVFVLLGIAVLLASGVGTCLMMILGRSPLAKQKWLNVFAGWLVGMVMGMVLFVHL